MTEKHGIQINSEDIGFKLDSEVYGCYSGKAVPAIPSAVYPEYWVWGDGEWILWGDGDEIEL